MIPEEQVDMVARYIAAKLLLTTDKIDGFQGSSVRRTEKWREALDEAKRELLANGLAKQV